MLYEDIQGLDSRGWMGWVESYLGAQGPLVWVKNSAVPCHFWNMKLGTKRARIPTVG